MEIRLSVSLFNTCTIVVNSCTFGMVQLLGYFAERMISKETLQRNNVMQVVGGKVRNYFYY